MRAGQDMKTQRQHFSNSSLCPCHWGFSYVINDIVLFSLSFATSLKTKGVRSGLGGSQTLFQGVLEAPLPPQWSPV